MSNPSKAKGTGYENEILVELRKIWPNATRAAAGSVSNDFAGIPFPVEAKHRKVWALKNWILRIREVAAPSDCWMICAADGDRRMRDSLGDVVIFPREFAFGLLVVYNHTIGSAVWSQQ